MSAWPDHVFPHGELTSLDTRLWTVTGSLKHGHMPRNMVIYKLEDGELLLHSAIALEEPAMAELEELGKPKILLVPNPMHRLDSVVYKERYPEITVICPSAARKKVSEKVEVDATCEELLPTMGIKVHEIAGVNPIELCYEVKLAAGGKALVFTDALMNMPHLPGFDGWLMKLIGTTGSFGMTKVGKLLLLKEKAAFKNWLLERAADSELRAILIAHGASVTENCSAQLKAAAERL